MKILVFGARGYLGSQVLSLFPGAISADADIADAVAVAEVLDRLKPDVVVNAAGKTGRPNVDWCEDHKEETLRSNVQGPLVLLEECGKRGIYWVHLGSGCIYEGDNGGRGYAENDPPNFTGSFYSRTKLWSDGILREFPVLNLRLRMPFDSSRSPRNLLTKLFGYKRVLDVKNSMTYIPDFLRALEQLVAGRVTGTFNMVNPGALSPYEIMCLYRDIVDVTHECTRLTNEELSSVVRAGRSNCVLSSKQLEQMGIALTPTKDAVIAALTEMAHGSPMA